MKSTNALLAVVIAMLLTTSSDADGCHHVAVVGGGIGGAYTAWKLRQLGLNVGLYELSDRLGGRFYTQHFPHAPDIPIELGAMRFSKEEHPIIYRTVQEVGLKTDLFSDHVHLSDLPMFFLRGKYLRNRNFKENRVPYNLHPNERLGIHGIYRYLTQKTNFSGDLALLHKELPYLVSEDGVRLTNQTIHEFLVKYLSEEAVEMIYNVSKFYLYNVSADTVLQFIPTDGVLPIYDMLKISGGMQQLPEQLVKQFLSASIKHSLHMNYQLVSITRKTRDSYNLGFMKTRTIDGKTIPTSQAINVCSQRVILAVPAPVLLQINWEVLHRRHILSNLNTVNYHVGVKLFLEYDFPWWAERLCTFDSYCESSNLHAFLLNCPKSATQCSSSCGDKYKRGIGINLISDLPLDMTFDFGISNKTGKAVLLAAYSVNGMWRELQKQGDDGNQGYHSVSTEVVRHVHMYLARLYNIQVTAIPTPTDVIISRWDAYPYEAPFSSSQAGVDRGKVWRTIHKPSATDDIFIASGSYSKRMSDAWSEYCLEAIEDILDTYF